MSFPSPPQPFQPLLFQCRTTVVSVANYRLTMIFHDFSFVSLDPNSNQHIILYYFFIICIPTIHLSSLQSVLVTKMRFCYEHLYEQTSFHFKRLAYVYLDYMFTFLDLPSDGCSGRFLFIFVVSLPCVSFCSCL